MKSSAPSSVSSHRALDLHVHVRVSGSAIASEMRGILAQVPLLGATGSRVERRLPIDDVDPYGRDLGLPVLAARAEYARDLVRQSSSAACALSVIPGD